MSENLFFELIKKYGEDFNWIETKNDVFVNQLNLELDKTHLLYARVKKALAKCESNDDVLFLLDNNDFAIVHLTYSTKNANGFPKHKYFSNLPSAISYIEQQFVSEFM